MIFLSKRSVNRELIRSHHDPEVCPYLRDWNRDCNIRNNAVCSELFLYLENSTREYQRNQKEARDLSLPDWSMIGWPPDRPRLECNCRYLGIALQTSSTYQDSVQLPRLVGFCATRTNTLSELVWLLYHSIPCTTTTTLLNVPRHQPNKLGNWKEKRQEVECEVHLTFSANRANLGRCRSLMPDKPGNKSLATTISLPTASPL
jgi:hypothetical protein